MPPIESIQQFIRRVDGQWQIRKAIWVRASYREIVELCEKLWPAVKSKDIIRAIRNSH